MSNVTTYTQNNQTGVAYTIQDTQFDSKGVSPQSWVGADIHIIPSESPSYVSGAVSYTGQVISVPSGSADQITVWFPNAPHGMPLPNQNDRFYLLGNTNLGAEQTLATLAARGETRLNHWNP